MRDTPLVEELLPAPLPWEAAARFAGYPFFVFLDSAADDSPSSRYSFVTADPFATLFVRGPDVYAPAPKRYPSGDPWAALAEHLAPFRMDQVPGLPPFQGGAAGLFGYGLCSHVERVPPPRRDEFHVPDMAVGLYDWTFAYDHRARRAWLLATGFPHRLEARRQQAAARARWAVAALKMPPRLTRTTRSPAVSQADLGPQFALPGLPGVTSNFERTAYLRAVQRAIDYIHAGDCFQVNLAQRLLHPATLAPWELYSRLRQGNPAPFAGYFDLGDFVVASASPERFLRVENGEVETRPIKGTRPRGATPEEDERQRRALLDSAKDRAENVMIVDLLRNDLGRVSAYGSVRVEALCRLESYRTVHHLVSEVRGRLRPEASPVDLLRAAFPGGSVTGAPKVRAMEIIAELEPSARGPYCGSLGYIGFDGSMDTNILIRTFTIGKGWIQFPVGGGIVADSTPDGEYAETLHKAEGLLRALRDTTDGQTTSPPTTFAPSGPCRP
jgi:para-aminobenzoate synthetase component 1